ncbi:MAG: hypothetical protein RLZZ453_674 [Chlamydiota bacterium]|jgi:hypothetical protein
MSGIIGSFRRTHSSDSSSSSDSGYYTKQFGVPTTSIQRSRPSEDKSGVLSTIPQSNSIAETREADKEYLQKVLREREKKKAASVARGALAGNRPRAATVSGPLTTVKKPAVKKVPDVSARLMHNSAMAAQAGLSKRNSNSAAVSDSFARISSLSPEPSLPYFEPYFEEDSFRQEDSSRLRGCAFHPEWLNNPEAPRLSNSTVARGSSLTPFRGSLSSPKTLSPGLLDDDTPSNSPSNRQNSVKNESRGPLQRIKGFFRSIRFKL